MKEMCLVFTLAIVQVLAEPTTVTANRAGGTQVFETNFVPKPCGELTAAELKHLTSAEVATMISVIENSMGPSTLCLTLWGHVVASNIPDVNNYINVDWVKLYANIVANILDRDGDGRVDDVSVELRMQTKAEGHYTIARATTMTDDQESDLEASMGQSTAIKQDEDFDADATINTSVGSATEEIFHTYEHALGLAHPSVFGTVDTDCTTNRRIGDNCGGQTSCDWTGSKLLKCGAAVMCNWYSSQLCCSKTGISASIADLTGGACSSPSCAGIEWYFNLMFSYLGQSWYDGDAKGYPDGLETLPGGVAFPMGTSAVESMLNAAGPDCVDFLAAIKNTTYCQLTAPIAYSYTATPVPYTLDLTLSPTPSPIVSNSATCYIMPFGLSVLICSVSQIICNSL